MPNDQTTPPGQQDGGGVHRLTDILTKEVSLVDRAANKKKRFVMIKRESPMGAGAAVHTNGDGTNTTGGAPGGTTPTSKAAIELSADSKALLPEERERLALVIRSRALALSLGAASVSEIGRYNIYHATTLAMRRALNRLSQTLAPDAVLIDGKPIKALDIVHQAVVQGDARCYAIACASIVAKVTRDRLMHSLDRRFPSYKWRENAGYGTPFHIAALRRDGLTAHHRVAFCRTALETELELPL